MAYLGTHEYLNQVDCGKWNVYDIPNGWTAIRPGVAVLKWNRHGGGNDAQIVVDGKLLSRQASRDNWGGCINAFVPQGRYVYFVLNESTFEYFKFIEM